MTDRAEIDQSRPTRLPLGLHSGRNDLVEEFMARPFGRHTPDLQALLNYMRGGPIYGKYFLWMIEPHRVWALALFRESPPLTPELVGDVTFDDIEDAERHVFRLRWETLFGSERAGTEG